MYQGYEYSEDGSLENTNYDDFDINNPDCHLEPYIDEEEHLKI